MVNIGDRLKEERERLRMTQESFSVAGGAGKRAYIRYEQGERLPDAGFLAAISASGADVLYVLTGRREMKPMTQSLSMSGAGRVAEQGAGYSTAMTLQPKEQQLVLRYRKCSDSGQAALLQMAAELSK